MRPGLNKAWELAPVLLGCGFYAADLDQLRQHFNTEQLPVVLELGSISYMTDSLLREMKGGARKISDIVKAMRSYTFLDQAEFQKVDIHEGLDNTLMMLKGQLNDISV